MQTREDRETTADDDREREHHQCRHWPPPEVERFDAARAENEEAEHQGDVRRIEDVRAAEADQIFRQQRNGRSRRVDPGAPQTPPVTVLRALNPQHERDAVPREERARRPHDHSSLSEDNADLQHRARSERDQDLGDREAKVERRLSEDLKGDDDRGEM